MSPSLAKCVEDALCQLSDSYAKTMEVGRRLCDGEVDAEIQKNLQLELQAVQEDWEHSASLLQQRLDLEHTVVKVEAKNNQSLASFLVFF